MWTNWALVGTIMLLIGLHFWWHSHTRGAQKSKFLSRGVVPKIVRRDRFRWTLIRPFVGFKIIRADVRVLSSLLPQSLIGAHFCCQASRIKIWHFKFDVLRQLRQSESVLEFQSELQKKCKCMCVRVLQHMVATWCHQVMNGGRFQEAIVNS